MAAAGEADLSVFKPQLNHTHSIWKQEMEQRQSQVDELQAKLLEVKASIKGSEEEAKRELEILCRRVKTTATLLTYLKSKARILAVPQLAHTSCGIKQSEGVGLVDKNGVPLSRWSKNMDISSLDSSDDSICFKNINHHGTFDVQDGAFIDEILKSVQIVTDVMESLVKRVIMAESEAAMEKEKTTLGQEEINKKAVQIENMSSRLEEMENFALGTNCILNEMRQRVEDLVEETSKQRRRAAENEQELSSVKRDFESLKSYVSSLISVRETLQSSERQFQTMEKLFERLVDKTTQLEGENLQKEAQVVKLTEESRRLSSVLGKKEAEVQKLMGENVRLTGLLDKKAAQLLAMNEQCKAFLFIALSRWIIGHRLNFTSIFSFESAIGMRRWTV